jgi:CMP-N-acetylneuraminic acid synthetase
LSRKVTSQVVGIIPARAGSKGVLGKNIRLLGGYPLLAYSIIASNLSSFIERTIVSTDSQNIADIARFYGAEVPFLRPVEIAQDNSTDLEFFEHAINWFEENEGMIPELMVQLRPTTPLRVPPQIDRAISYIKDNPKASSLRSGHQLAEPPQKMFQIDDNGFFQGFFPDDPQPEYYNLPRQMFPKAYHPNGYVDIIKPDFVKENNTLYGPNILAFVTEFAVEADKLEDFDYLEYLLKKDRSPIYEYLLENFSKES